MKNEKIKTISAALVEHENEITKKYNFHLFKNDLITKNRKEVEKNFNLKQIIGIGIIKNKDKILCYQRNKDSAEKRLIEKYSIGVGGHMSENDIHPIATMLREMNEEFSAFEINQIKYLGAINTDIDNVSKCHIGFVYVLEVDSLKINPLEKTLIKSDFKTKKEIQKLNIDQWTKIIIEGLNV